MLARELVISNGPPLPAPLWVVPRCSIERDPRRDDHTICTATAPEAVFLTGSSPPGPTPVLQRQHAIDNPAHLMAKWIWLSNLLQSGILTTNEIRDLDRRLSGRHQNC
jgi:hypothetical protein